jgi:hypothetical protein
MCQGPLVSAAVVVHGKADASNNTIAIFTKRFMFFSNYVSILSVTI